MRIESLPIEVAMAVRVIDEATDTAITRVVEVVKLLT